MFRIAAVMKSIMSKYEEKVENAKKNRKSEADTEHLRSAVKAYALKSLHGYRPNSKHSGLDGVSDGELDEIFNKIKNELEKQNLK